MSLVDNINLNTAAVSNGKTSLKKAINNKGGYVPDTGNIPTFQELINGLGNVIGNDSGTGALLNVVASAPITKGSPVEVSLSNSETLQLVGEELPSTAKVGDSTLNILKDWNYPPYISRTGRFLAVWYGSTSTSYLIPFYKVDGEWKQMTVDGVYTGMYNDNTEKDWRLEVCHFDEMVYPRKLVAGKHIYDVNTSDLDVTLQASFTTTRRLSRVFMHNNHIFTGEIKGTTLPPTYTVVYKYDPVNQTVTELHTASGLFDDITTSGTDVFTASTRSASVRKYRLNSGQYELAKTLNISYKDYLHNVSISAGCSTLLYCDGSGSGDDLDYNFHQNLIDPNEFYYTSVDIPVKFSDNVNNLDPEYVCLTKDFKYLFLEEHGYIGEEYKARLYKWYIDKAKGTVGYNFVAYITTSNTFSPVLDPDFGFSHYRWNIHSLSNIILCPDDDYTSPLLYNPVNVESGYYTGIPTSVISLGTNLIGYGYALDDIPLGETGTVCMLVYENGALQTIAENEAVVNNNIDSINGESI